MAATPPAPASSQPRLLARPSTMAAARRGFLAGIFACLLVLWVAAPAFLPSATSVAPAPRALAAASAAAPLVAMAQPALAAEGDGTISGTEWAGYVTLALVLFVFVNAQQAANQGKEAR
eukprot:CAMPEP_0204554352 /NCGR_PEP_ID=MMETSP0661-20131031/28032_1 /ASSEMBLY_ACC=CAM_ASM_000606 /TAXON_ID=109239 /ORGANISM="Alexandrium margalefi, Strain AMGDE01CS-322" /LENGTH=118 /DNA_ID=CAMNT_0051561415 /DNA_START=35 /DNA_END=388 /DNA_ORIENTATION=-